MSLKAIIQQIASWFRTEAKTVEQKADSIDSSLKAEIESALRPAVTGEVANPVSTIVPIEVSMTTPADGTTIAAATPISNLNIAVQIALALKAIDASLSVDAIQAATNAALAAAYPVAG